MTTTKAKHTPGPWHTPGESCNPMLPGNSFHKPEAYKCFGIGNGACHVGYASITGCVEHDEALANAKLIAAAPELLEACKRLLCAFESDFERVPDLDIKTCWETNSQAVALCRTAIAKAEGQDV